MKNSIPTDLFSFAAIAGAGGFTKASKELGVSASVLSKRIERLETDLGVSLLQRTTRTVRLTDAGQKCYDEIISLRSGFKNIIERIRENHETPQGTLRVSTLSSFASTQLEPALWGFMGRFPQIKLELVLGQPNVRLMENNIDVGIFIKEVPDSRLIVKKIGSRKMVVCASPAYIEKQGAPKKPESLVNHNCLLYRAESIKNQWRFKKNVVTVEGNFSVNSSQLLMKAALQGKGVAKLPGYLVEHSVRDGRLVSLLDDHCPKDIGIYAAYAYSRQLSPNVKVFVDFLTGYFQKS